MAKCPRVPLGDIAPKVDAPMPSSDVAVWNLSLADIEADTGAILNRKRCLASELGSSKCSFDSRHVLYSKLRPYLNKVVVPDQPGVGTSELLPLLPDPERLHRQFLAHYLRSPEFVNFAVAHSRGANLPRVAMRSLWTHPIPVPPMTEQRRIIRQIHRALERVREIQKLRRESFAEATELFSSFLGDLEKGSRWPQLPLGKLIKSRNGQSVRTRVESGNGYVLKLSAVRDVMLDFSKRKHVELEAKTVQTFQVKRNDVFVSRSNTRDLVGLSAVAASNPMDATIFPDLLIRLRPIDGRILPRFLAYALRFPTVRDQIRIRAKGTSQSMVKISGASLKEVLIPVPQKSDQEAAVATLDKAHEVNRRLTRTLDSTEPSLLRQAVLRKAFAGEL